MADHGGSIADQVQSEKLGRVLNGLAPAQSTNCKWTMEKIWDLNASRSKRLTVGMDLERQLTVSAVIESNTGLGVRLSKTHMQELLSPAWMSAVLQHFKFPQTLGASRTMDNFEMKCIIIHDRDPGLRIATVDPTGRQTYVILGEVSCRLLFMYAPAIMYQVTVFSGEVSKVEEWLRGCLSDLKSLTAVKGITTRLTSSYEAQAIVAEMAEKVSAPENAVIEICDRRTEFLLDVLYRHRELTARILYLWITPVDII